MLSVTIQAQTASAADGDGFVGPIVTHTAKYDPKDEAGRPIAPATPVIVGIVVDEKGNPQNIRVVRSSGMQEADASSIQAVSQYRFKPARENGRPVSVNLYIELIARSAPLFSPNWDPRAVIVDSPTNPSSPNEVARKLSPDIKPPEVLRWAKPVLPQDTFGPVRLKVRTVILQIVVDRTGMPTNPKVFQSSGDPSFHRSALDAVSKYRFKPAVENGNPVPVELKVEVKFDHIYR